MNEKRTLIQSFNNAVEGIIYVLRTQKNMQRHFLTAALVLTVSLFLGIGKVEFLILMFSIALVLITELINTAIESAIDITTTAFDPLAKIAKDVAAAAVLLSAINAVVVGVIVFYSKMRPLTLEAVVKLRSMDIYITIIGLFLVLIMVVALKTFKSEHSFFKGGWVSGHSAVAFFALTSIIFLTEDALVAMLGFIMALLICQTRIEAKIHRPAEVIAGALLGFFVALLVFQVFKP
ncbi:MAG: phosphatase PAP2 family protein [Actinobacteria bacterium]|nr:MAG: phosphatase PAP2 family protein [Actinomycetota bacterium]